ncbi:MAG: UDP-3-O-acyl-N-acetylglucosamine deacetylase [Deltaproteobacteria bacterium]|nr:UDP-3-O-acyl-N-acetylglucosamine deacetylase [Deltaproteobacteria bacterium]
MQTTLKRKINLKGIGLHAGAKVTCVIHPAPANHGIVFLRSDLTNQPRIRADISKVVRTDMSTTLGAGGAVVATVEHLLAALIGMGVDNALIEINGPEVPIMDGSSKEFADAIDDAGVRELAVSRKALQLRRKVAVRAGDKYIVAEPAKKLTIKGSISFGHKVIGEQVYRFSSGGDFQKELASARTFGFLREVEYLHKKGLALGGSLDNAVVLDEARVLNPDGLRYKNEFVRHKVLDALGDFALIGMGIQASIEVHKSGHELHTGFIRKVLEDPSNYQIVELGKAATATSDVEEDDLDSLLAAAY